MMFLDYHLRQSAVICDLLWCHFKAFYASKKENSSGHRKHNMQNSGGGESVVLFRN